MKTLLVLTTALGLAVTPALAQGKSNGNGPRIERALVPGQGTAARVATPSTGACPPGLAKKTPACVPPGLARSGGYGIGDRLDREYILIDRRPYGLPPLAEGQAYVRVGDAILVLDREERLILDILDLALN